MERKSYNFDSAADLLALCRRNKARLSEIAIRYEMAFARRSRREVMEKMERVRTIMLEAIEKSIKRPEESAFGMGGKDARKLFKFSRTRKKHLASPLVLRAMAYATATGETNSAMGRIAAFPTAGGAGVIPGVMIAGGEFLKCKTRKVLRGLFAASAVGMVVANKATLSAAAAGCQAEVGAAVAMAAAGITEMRGGTPAQALNASALALKSYLGLACDPLGGLVAVPCIKRNMLGASAACAASDASMAGVQSYIPFDEVVEAMNNIAATMSPAIRETALGGLAITPTGMKIRRKLGLPPLPGVPGTPGATGTVCPTGLPKSNPPKDV
jgi:L-serine dehydratase